MRKGFQFLAGTALWFLATVAFYVLSVRNLKVDVVFYSALGDTALATMVAAVILFWSGFFKSLTKFEKFLSVLLWLTLGYSLAISLPTVIDRSLSIYILEKLEQRGGGIRQDAFARVFTEEYLREHHLVEVRLTEQLESGTINLKAGCVKLTPKGASVVRFSRFFRQNLLPRQRLLMGAYSDELVDPFRESTDSPDYRCQ
ncbi:hypothetical protein [Ferribacterium limneticum]|uniref:hypothetical protein n=1 Tax=Ferribacterium limneticum TaxID=76259 RepID=UPI001CFA030F|nr:hypothetical protein [Ferribacterium limneticum]UCV19543.1 hypothetical protein KI610_02870 [Ferribacterium limneticum]